MKITTTELELKLAKAAEQIVSHEEARYFAQETVEAHLRKAPRTSPLKASIGDLETSLAHKEKVPSHNIDLPSFVSINFQSHGPLVYLKRVHDLLEDRSSTNGIAMIAFTNSQSMHTLHTWVQGLAKRGLVAIAMCNGGPGAVVPFNGTRGLFGTNPMAYGIPDTNGEIHCVDMATSEIPYFEILAAHKNKTPLRDRAAVDAQGEFTTDADKALDFSASATDPVSNLTSMGGGYKGYYLTYLMEILTSGLIHMPSSPEMSTSDFVPEEHGAILLAFNPLAMGSAQSLPTSIAVLDKAIKSQKPKAGTAILLPGEENSKRYADLKDQEIEVDDTFLGRLTNISQ